MLVYDQCYLRSRNIKRLLGYIFLFLTLWSLTAHASSQVKLWDFRLGDDKKKSIETIKSISDYYDSKLREFNHDTFCQILDFNMHMLPQLLPQG
jgi:hypothetical protein